MKQLMNDKVDATTRWIAKALVRFAFVLELLLKEQDHRRREYRKLGLANAKGNS